MGWWSRKWRSLFTLTFCVSGNILYWYNHHNKASPSEGKISKSNSVNYFRLHPNSVTENNTHLVLFMSPWMGWGSLLVSAGLTCHLWSAMVQGGVSALSCYTFSCVWGLAGWRLKTLGFPLRISSCHRLALVCLCGGGRIGREQVEAFLRLRLRTGTQFLSSHSTGQDKTQS